MGWASCEPGATGAEQQQVQQLHPEGSGQVRKQGQAKEEQPGLAGGLMASSEV